MLCRFGRTLVRVKLVTMFGSNWWPCSSSWWPCRVKRVTMFGSSWWPCSGQAGDHVDDLLILRSSLLGSKITVDADQWNTSEVEGSRTSRRSTEKQDKGDSKKRSEGFTRGAKMWTATSYNRRAEPGSIPFPHRPKLNVRLSLSDYSGACT